MADKTACTNADALTWDGMDTIDLKCPSCQTRLTIDSGFAGGVCRCWKCGTLMTVPSRKRSGQSDPSDRPQRPDAPLPRPAAPVRRRQPDRRGAAGSARPTPLPNAPSPSPNRPAGTGLSAISSGGAMHASHASARLPTAPAVPPSAAPSHHLSASSTSPASPEHHAPSAGPSATADQSARRSRLGVLLVVLAVLMIVAGALLYVATTIEDPIRRIDQMVLNVMNQHRARHNPLLTERATFLGLPLDRKVVLVMDTSADQTDWLAVMRDAAVRAMGYLPAGASMQILGWADQQPIAFPSKLRALEPSDQLGMETLFAQLTPAPAADPQLLVRQALMTGATQVVLITDRPLSSQQVRAIAQDLTVPPAIRFDAVLIEVGVPELEPVTRQHKGQQLKLSRKQLAAWHTQALELQQATVTP